jgi:hypothetical protein
MLPPAQCWLGPTARSQMPQWNGSLAKSTQELPHSVCAVEHPVTQRVPSHTGAAAPHWVLQLLQVSALFTEASQPSVSDMLQFKNPVEQAQTPALHVELAPQSWLQLPHVLGSASDASQPSLAVLLQSAKPAVHTHALATQSWF